MQVLKHSRGILAALVTPFTSQGDVHEESMRRIIRHSMRLGVSGYYVCGSTGEGFSLSLEERMRCLEIVVDEVGDRGDVIANISHMEIRQLQRLGDHAAEVGVGAVSTLPPIYTSISNAELLAYFQHVLKHSRLPVTVYNIPQLAQRALDEQIVEKLAADPKFIGVKHSSEDTRLLTKWKQIDEGRLRVWSGRDAYYLGCLAMGADGAIGSTFQLLGDIFCELTAAFRVGDLDRALTLQQRVNQVHARLQTHGPIRSIKRCLTLLGCETGECRLPNQPLGSQYDSEFKEILAEADLLRKQFGLRAVPCIE
ncbi:dihydrodipicolinate synthase family protein [Planctomicrobium sp. SH661]|uniref:dihydrodipicolinate synthase family protein n=1 Tax=Planctomicrobium sp. SH661 TaxID=3448124 RepID=UPI003F5B2755